MRIIGLHAENIKKLKVVDIDPDKTLNKLTGPNASGKTSLLDTIAITLSGDVLKTVSEPLRKGTEKGVGQVVLGETGEPVYTVTRTFTSNDKSYLKVESPDGAQYKSPQGMLNKLIGNLSFDPLAFSNLKDKEQVGTLLKLVQLPLDLDKWAEDRKQIFDERTAVNRGVSDLHGQVKGFPEFPADLPSEEIAAASILKEQREAQGVIAFNNDRRKLLHTREKNVEELQHRRASIVDRIEQFKVDLAAAEEGLVDINKTLECEQQGADNVAEEVRALVDPDLTVFDQRITEVEGVNRLVRSKQQKTAVEEKLTLAQNRSKTLTDRLTAKDEEKLGALRSVKMPIEGLTFDDNGLFYNSVPFNQCSSGERLKVSTAMGMALNPRLRVMFIRDGSLLDNKHREVLRQMALDNDYQLWMEITDDTGKIGLYFEDGELVTKG